MDGFLKLKNRYVIEGMLIPAGGLHVGSGSTGKETDATFMKDGLGYVIPGSSLRGAMRSLVERIVQTLPPERGCVLFEEGSASGCLTASTKTKQLAFEKLRREDEKAACKELDTGLCVICKLFGSPYLASKLKVADSRPTSSPNFQFRHGVGINRDTETAEDGVKFDFEVIEAGSQFTFRLELENAEGPDFALLGILLREMTEQGIYVGGKKARGLGLVKLEPAYSVSGFESLIAFLGQNKGKPTNLKISFQAKMDQSIQKFLKETHAA